MNRVALMSGILALSFSAMGCEDRAPTRAVSSATPAASATAPVAATAIAPIPSPSPSIVTLPTTATAPSTATPTSPVVADASPPRPLAQHLTVKRLVVSRGVKDHEPLDPETSIRATDTGRVYAFVEVENKGHAPGEVFVSFPSRPRAITRSATCASVGESPLVAHLGVHA